MVQYDKYILHHAMYIWHSRFERMTDLSRKNRVKLARVENDLTQAQLAEKAGVTRQTIGLIEAGRFNPSLKLCMAIAKALNKTLDDLFWIEEEEERG
jgi:putative transcriptional regulator